MRIKLNNLKQYIRTGINRFFIKNSLFEVIYHNIQEITESFSFRIKYFTDEYYLLKRDKIYANSYIKIDIFL